MSRIATVSIAVLAVSAFALAAASFLLLGSVRADLRALSEKLDAADTRAAPAAAESPARASWPTAPTGSRQVDAPAVAATRSGANMAAPAPDRALDPVAIAQARQAWLAENRAALAAEPHDPAWAEKTESVLVDASTHEDLADSVREMQDFRAECRSRSCAVEARFSSRGAAMEWQGMYLLNAPPLANAQASVVPNGDGTYTVYLFGRG